MTLGLQGCGGFCDGGAPITDRELDFEALDREAGCKNEWDFMWGNPCASDVPVLWAKKGAERHADLKHMYNHVENEYYNCNQWSTSGYFCYAWSANEISCDEEDWGECICLTEAPNGKYCETWQCIAKEASQNECWEACCGDECTPCVQCGLQGSSPFPMNQQVYQELMALEGVVLGGSEQDTVDSLRQSYFGAVTYNGECIISREIHMSGQSPCNVWRTIETELSYCWCTETADEEYCRKWICEEKDTGMFSILFYRAMEYSPYVDGIEREMGTCEASTVNENGGTQCSRWTIESSSYEEVEMAFCQACHTSWGCSEWMCDEYELPRVHDVDDWWKRLFFLLVHLAWIIPGVMLVDIVASSLAWEGGGTHSAVCSTCCGMVFLLCMCYALCFLRWEEAGHWRTPGSPWSGLWVTVGPAWLFAVLCNLMLCGGNGSNFIPPSLAYLPTFILAGVIWTIGAAPLFVLLGALIPICCCVIGDMMKNQAKAKIASAPSSYAVQTDDDQSLASEPLPGVLVPLDSDKKSNASSASLSSDDNNMEDNNNNNNVP